MARIRIVQQGSLFVPVCVLSANERDEENVGSVDVPDKGGAIAESAHVLEKDVQSVGDFSGPIHSTEPDDESKHDFDIPVEAVDAHKEVSDVLKATDEVHSANQGLPESCGRLLSTPLKRSSRRVASQVPDSEATKRTKRAGNWTTEETEALITCKLQPSLPRGNAGWELISSQIPGRSTQRCRQRWDTVKKSYKKMKGYCVAHSKELSQISKDEFESMKLDMSFFTNGDWYKMIDDYSSRPKITSSGPAANELNGASTSTHPVGKPNVPSSACPNLEASRPKLMPADISVEQGPAAGEPTGWRQYEEAGIFTDNYLVLLKTKRQQRCEEAKPMLFNLWWLLLHPFPLHRELKQKVTEQQQQPGLIDRFHTWSSRRLSFLQALKDSLPNLDAKWLAALVGANFHSYGRKQQLPNFPGCFCNQTQYFQIQLPPCVWHLAILDRG